MTVLFLIGITSPSYAAPGDTRNGKEPPGATTSAEVKAEQKPEPKAEPKSKSESKPAPRKPEPQDLNSPQPLSNADQNTGGANGQCGDDGSGPYCSTRDGSPSGNGNGDGEAVGKPCAGCVGKADNKNPTGQMPDGTDHNAGYECDRNRGIGQTNPAHTGCVSGEEPPEPPGPPNPPEPPTPPGPPEVPPGPPVTPPGGVEGERCPENPALPLNSPDCDVVGGVEQERPRPPAVVLTPPMTVTGPSGAAPSVAGTAATVLPSTGADGLAGILGLGGLAMLLAGLGTLVARRRLG